MALLSQFPAKSDTDERRNDEFVLCPETQQRTLRLKLFITRGYNAYVVRCGDVANNNCFATYNYKKSIDAPF